MLPWSVIAIAVWPSFAACSTSSSTWQAPSSRLYSVWRWRWTKSFVAVIGKPASFPLDRGRRLARHVVDHAVHALHLVHDPVRDPRQDVVGQARPVGRHAVGRVDGADHHRRVIRPIVSHDAD